MRGYRWERSLRSTSPSPGRIRTDGDAPIVTRGCVPSQCQEGQGTYGWAGEYWSSSLCTTATPRAGRDPVGTGSGLRLDGSGCHRQRLDRWCSRVPSDLGFPTAVTRYPEVSPAHVNWTRAVNAARGEYVKLVCADDEVLPGAISAQVAALDAHPSAVLAAGRRRVINASGRVLMESRGLERMSGLVPGSPRRRGPACEAAPTHWANRRLSCSGLRSCSERCLGVPMRGM